MSFLGSLLGYDRAGGDLMGVNRDENLNCLVCGRSVYHHSAEAEMACFRALYAKPTLPDAAYGPQGREAGG